MQDCLLHVFGLFACLVLRVCSAMPWSDAETFIKQCNSIISECVRLVTTDSNCEQTIQTKYVMTRYVWISGKHHDAFICFRKSCLSADFSLSSDF